MSKDTGYSPDTSVTGLMQPLKPILSILYQNPVVELSQSPEATPLHFIKFLLTNIPPIHGEVNFPMALGIVTSHRKAENKFQVFDQPGEKGCLSLTTSH